MKAGNAVITNEATELFHRHLDHRKLATMTARVAHLQSEDAELRARHDKRELETHEFLVYFQKEIQTRDTQLTTLSEELAAVRLNHALVLKQMQHARDSEHQHLLQQAVAKEESASNEIAELRQELDQLQLFREMKDSIAIKVKDLETQVILEKEQACETFGALERKFLKEKACMQIEHEKTIQMIHQQAKENACNELNIDARKMVTERKRIGEELRFQLQMTDELHREKQQSEARAKTLNMELQLQYEKETECAKQALRQARELTHLRASLREAEHKLGAGLAAASWEAHAYAARHEREREDLMLDVESRRKLVFLKNRELRNLRRLAQSILNQRTDVEQFCLDSLEYVKHEIIRERKDKHKREIENYHQQVNGAHGTKPSLRNVKLIFPSNCQMQPGPPEHVTEKVDMHQLSWTDRERVLRLVFAKINRSKGSIDMQGARPPETSETALISLPCPDQKEKKKQSTAVYFATEPRTRHNVRAAMECNSLGEETLSASLYGIPLVPRAPTQTNTGSTNI